MALKNETSVQCTSEPISNIHQVMFQTLERNLGYDEYGLPIFFPKDAYQSAIENANNVKIVFSSGVHPDFELYDVDPAKAIREAGGREAGVLLNPYINTVGHPMAYGDFGLYNDPDIELLNQEGHLSMSPSLGLTRDEKGNITKIRLQNILIFPEIPGGEYVPRDPGTKLLNSQHNPLNKKSTIQKTGNTMTEKPDGAQAPIDLAGLAEMVAQFTASSKKAEEEKAQFTAMLEAKDKALADLQASIAKQEAARKDSEFKALIEDPNFPVGMKAGDGFEATLRAEFEASPVQFTKKVVTAMATLGTQLPGEQGAQFTGQKPKKHTDAEIAIYKKLGLSEAEYPEA